MTTTAPTTATVIGECTMDHAIAGVFHDAGDHPRPRPRGRHPTADERGAGKVRAGPKGADTG